MDIVYMAVDGSEYACRGLSLGRNIAVQLGVPLVVVSVVSDEAKLEGRHDGLVSRLNDAGDSFFALAPVEVFVDRNPVEALVDLVKRDGATLCMGTHGRNPLPEMVLGSVAYGVVNKSSSPVILCGPKYDSSKHEKVEVVCACVDGSPLSEEILPHAIKLSRLFGARLQLVHAIETDSSFSDLSSVSHGDVVESSYVHRLANHLEKDYAMKVEWEVVHGGAAYAVASYLDCLSNVMVAMTTHGRSGVSQVLAGSVTHELLHNLKCPVAVLKP